MKPLRTLRLALESFERRFLLSWEEQRELMNEYAILNDDYSVTFTKDKNKSWDSCEGRTPIKQTRVGDFLVSSIFLPLNFDYLPYKHTHFECAVFSLRNEIYIPFKTVRARTYKELMKIHKELVRKCEQ